MVPRNSTIPDWNDAEGFEIPEMPECVDIEAMGRLSVVGGFAQRAQTFELEQEHTLDHFNCPACKAANAALQAEKVNIASMSFSEARKFWTLLRAQSTSLKERTHETDTDYLNALEKFFGKLRLRDIMPGHLRGYQIARMHNLLRVAGEELHPWKRQCGHSIINHELSLLSRILNHCRLWARIKPYYFPLKTPKWSPREILNDEDEKLFFNAAAADPHAGVAYWVAAITANTSASGIELRGLRLKHILLRDAEEISEIDIPEDSVKNDNRPRKIPLNPLAKWAVEQCYKRALKIGSCEPEHYLFPFRDRKKNKYNPELPPSRWVFRWSWAKLREATGFSKVKPHDFRFLFITKALEAGEDPEAVRAVAGHVSQRMVEYYAKHRRKAKYAVVMAIAPEKKAKQINPKQKKPPASAHHGVEHKRKLG